MHKQIASVVRSWTTDKVPDVIYKEASKVGENYKYETTEKEFVEYTKGVIENRKKEMEELLIQLNSKENKDKNK